MSDDLDSAIDCKKAAARAAAELVQDGMAVGLGTGSTVAYLLSALGLRARELGDARFVATSPATARIARELGLRVLGLDELLVSAGDVRETGDMGHAGETRATGEMGAAGETRATGKTRETGHMGHAGETRGTGKTRTTRELGELDIVIDGADQIDPRGWLIKGGGGAHTREKIVVSAARRFVVIVSEDKLVPRLTPPVPLEVLEFGAHHTLALLGRARLRRPEEHGVGAATHAPRRTSESPDRRPCAHEAGAREAGAHEAGAREAVRSPDGNLLAWYDGPIEEPRALATRLSQTPGVVEHGLFTPEMVSEVLVGAADGVRRRLGGKSS